jgi:medium-chain acyl-[acyl-carrier-protein] hydrolase
MVALANTAEINEGVRSVERMREDRLEEASGFPAVCENERLWLPYRRERKGAHVRLFLFHWAGASASAYFTWEDLASEDIEVCAVQMPGREDFDITRYAGEATMSDLADQFLGDVGHLFAASGVKPVFFAHGTGSWFAFEVARKLEAKKRQEQPGCRFSLQPPAAFFVSCFPAPDLAVGERPWPALSKLKKKSDFAREMCTTWSVPVIALRAPAHDTFHECLKRDFAAIDQYCVDPNPNPNADADAAESVSLTCPVSLFLALDDPFVGPNSGGAPVLMEAWGKVSTAEQKEEIYLILVRR